MGLFFNYDKPGPGVEKDAPRKKGAPLYFELLGRNFSKLMLANMLYFAVSLPVFAIYFIIISYFSGIAMPDAAGTMASLQINFIITLMIMILWGVGPVSCGYAYILRNTAREEHTFLASDFFEKSKESFIRGVVFWFIDLVMLVSSATAVIVYKSLSESMGGIYTVLLFASGIIILLYTIMHFYIYEFEVTFENKLLQVYKNSFIMSLSTLPMCILITFIIYFCTTVILGFLNPILSLIIAFVFWISVMRFIVDFYVARTIKRKLLTENENK